MSVKIEILDYVYGEFEGTQMLSNNSFASSSDWDLGSGWTISGGSANHSGSNGFLRQDNNFFQGQTYRIKYKISGRTQGSLILANHLEGGANGFVQINNGTFEYDWVQGASNTTRLNLAGWSGFDGSVEYVNIYPISGINWEDSIEGELDITDHSDFPLALTFQVSEIKDVTSTTGDYSKSFKIPATKNNNKIFKHLYNPSIDHPNTATENKPCRILVNNLYSLVGTLKVTGLGGYGDTSSYYNCVFYGNNLGWGNGLEGQYMNDINWGSNGEGLTYNKDSIVATWQDENCDSSTSPIVYPVTSYGDCNPNGIYRTIQLLDTAGDANGWGSSYTGYWGWDNNGNSYGTPSPVADWRPAVFVKDTLEKIFSQTSNGAYTINSTFMDTDMFKKLVWLLPNAKYNNPDDRYDDFSVLSKFKNGVTLDAASQPSEDGVQRFYEASLQETDGNAFYTGTGREILDISSANLTVTLDNGSYVDTTNNYITIGEFGIYDLNIGGLASKIAEISKTGTTNRVIDSLDTRINLEVQTVGQTSWNIINFSENTHTVGTSVNVNNPYFAGYKNLENIQETRFLNKGDKIRITFGIRVFATTASQAFIAYVFFKQNGGHLDINFNPEYLQYGQTFDLSNLMNSDYKQIDFIKGITHAFNLKMTTNEGNKTIDIEPADSFYKTYGSAIDWTYRLDRSRETQDKFLKSDLKRNFVFKYKTDSKDKKVEYRGNAFFNGILDEYPYQEQLPSNFEKGDSVFENPFFAGTFNAKDQDSTHSWGSSATDLIDTNFSACLWSENVSANDFGRPDKGFEFQPRLLYWNKYSPAGGGAGTPSMNKRATVQTWISYKEVVADSNLPATGSILSNIYPQATSINRDDSSCPVLSYGNVWRRDWNSATGEYTTYSTGEGLYATYYKKMFEMFKQNPRLRTVYIDLKISDIVNLDFRKLIYLDGCYWKLNKINDYMPNKNQPTKVELIEWFELGVFAAEAPSFGTSYSGGVGVYAWQPPYEEPINTNSGL